MAFSDAVSLAAFAVSAFAVFISWRAYRRDGPKIKFIGFDFETSAQLLDSHFLVSIVNAGGGRVVIERAQLRFEAGCTIDLPMKEFSGLGFSYERPTELQTGNKITAKFRVYGESRGKDYTYYLYPLRCPPYEVKEAVFIDTAGKKYKKKAPRSLKEQISHQWPQEIEVVRS